MPNGSERISYQKAIRIHPEPLAAEGNKETVAYGSRIQSTPPAAMPCGRGRPRIGPKIHREAHQAGEVRQLGPNFSSGKRSRREAAACASVGYIGGRLIKKEGD
jgi:hypothetical protein